MIFFHGGGFSHIEVSPLICSANQWTDFCDRDLRYERAKELVEKNVYDIKHSKSVRP